MPLFKPAARIDLKRNWDIYAVAIALVIAATVIRWLLTPILGNGVPYITFFPVVAIAGWYGGWRSALAATLLSLLIAWLLIIPPRFSIGLGSAGEVVGLVIFLIMGTVISVVSGAYHAALDRSAKAEREAIDHAERLKTTLASIGDAVITTNAKGRILDLNRVTEEITGWTHEQAVGRPLEEVFRIINETTREPAENPAQRALAAGVITGLANHTLLICKDGTERPIDDSAAPIVDQAGRISGCVLVFRDVSARRQLELEKSEQLLAAKSLAAIVESSDDAIVGKTLDGTIRSWNAAAERIFGYTAEDAIGQNITLIIPPERTHEEQEIIAKIKQGIRIDHFETVRQTKDGQFVHVSLTISPIKDAAGNVIGASKIARDVTAKRSADERVRHLLADSVEANAKFHAFFEQGQLLAAIIDPNGHVIDLNRFACEGCGYRREQIVGHRLWNGPWWMASSRSEIESGVALAANGETFWAELTYLHSDGSQCFADVTIQPICDESGRILFLALMGADITDRRRVEMERQSFVTLIENSTDFIAMCDPDGEPFYINRAGLELVGLESIDEARQHLVSEFFFPEDQKLILGEFLPSVAAHGHGEIEIRFRHFGTAEAIWMVYKVLALKNGEGEVTAYATVSQNISRRKKLEEDLRASANDLAEAGRRKDEFLAMLAHELRNPLAPIRSGLDLLGMNPGMESETIKLMQDQVEHVVRLVDDLLDVSRITRGRIELRKEIVAIGELVRRSVRAIEPLATSRNQVIECSPADEESWVEVDPVRIVQVIENLLNNASKYSEPESRIRLAVQSVGDEVQIVVSDNGMGIEQELLPQVFELFTQSSRSLDRALGGLGIGLTLVKQLIELHGGSVRAESEGPGHGSTFTIRLPLTAPPASSTASIESPTRNEELRRILIVDDNDGAAYLLSKLIGKLGDYEIAITHDGPSALTRIEGYVPDIVFLDIGLPGMDGYQVARNIRSEPRYDSVTIIALTGYGQSKDRALSAEAGCDLHLVKPPSIDQIQDALSWTHQRRRS